jgi:hypothetical protein
MRLSPITEPSQAPQRGREVEAYVAAILKAPLRLTPWTGAAGLPVDLARRYAYFEGAIHGRPCLFMMGDEPVTSAETERHVAEAAKRFDGVVIIVRHGLSAKQRSALIGRGVAFIVPGNQFFVPDLALDLRERLRAPTKARADALPPAAQAVLFHRLIGRSDDAATATTLAPQLGYTVMTIGRAFDEIARFELGSIEKIGREKRLILRAPLRALIDAAAPRLRNPAQRIAFARKRAGVRLPCAGETALAHYTDLNSPRLPTFAVGAQIARADLSVLGLEETDEDDADARIEIWSYDPLSIGDARAVDRLSLYAQYRDHPDERLAQAADALLETFA